MTNTSIDYHIIQPDPFLIPYVKFFWHLSNKTNLDKQVVILPDGYFDIIYHASDNTPFETLLVGLSTEPATYTIPAHSVCFSISFKLPAAEYVLNTKMADLLNQQVKLGRPDWDVDKSKLSDFRSFVHFITRKITDALIAGMDNRKQQLFDLLYSRAGLIHVEDIANTTNWSSRQINRYFTEWFGLSLKKYCNILRYRASFKKIKDGKLFPEDHFTDQAHFIKEIRKYSGVTPKELLRNENDRFIQFSTLPDE